MTTNFKYKDDDTIYKIESACTTVFWTTSRWYIFRGGVPQHRPFSDSPKTYRPLEEVEWFEYRCIVPPKDMIEVSKWWYGILRASSIGRFLYMKHGRPRYRFTLDEPFTRMLFIITLMRHTEEHLIQLTMMYDWYRHRPNWARYLTADQIMALFSAHYLPHNNHAVFSPAVGLRGLFNRMGEYMDAMTGESTPIRDQEYNGRKPGTVGSKLFKSTVTYPLGRGMPNDMCGWYNHFTYTAPVNPLAQNNDADLSV